MRLAAETGGHTAGEAEYPNNNAETINIVRNNIDVIEGLSQNDS
jgi:hypothetical protein